ncbi:unnamed protein product, partial [Prorocentrum cordatum]
AVGQNQQSDTPSKSSRPHRCPREGPLSREAVGGSRRVRAERRSGRSAHRADGPRCIIAGGPGPARNGPTRRGCPRTGGRDRPGAAGWRKTKKRSGGEGRRRGARAGRRNAIATLRTVAAAAAPPRLGGGADTQGALPLGDPRGGGRPADIILRDLGHMWASGRLVVLNRRIPVACSAGRLPRQANVRGRRGGRARAAGRGRRGGGGPSPEEQEQQKHEDEKEALKRGTKKLAPTRRRATLPRAREEPAGEARRRRASRRRHISGAPRRAEAARRRTGGSGERHQHTNSEVRAKSQIGGCQGRKRATTMRSR